MLYLHHLHTNQWKSQYHNVRKNTIYQLLWTANFNLITFYNNLSVNIPVVYVYRFPVAWWPQGPTIQREDKLKNISSKVCAWADHNGTRDYYPHQRTARRYERLCERCRFPRLKGVNQATQKRIGENMLFMSLKKLRVVRPKDTGLAIRRENGESSCVWLFMAKKSAWAFWELLSNTVDGDLCRDFHR